MSEEIKIQPVPQLIEGKAVDIATPIGNEGSQILGVSLRGLIVILLVLTVCILSIMKIQVTDPLNTLVLSIVSLYMGHQIGLSQKK